MAINIDINTNVPLSLTVLGASAFALGTEAYVYAGHLDAL